MWFTSLNWGHVQLNYPYILNYHFHTLKEIGNFKRVNFFASIGPWPGTSNNLVPPTIAVGLSPSLHMTVPEFVVDPSRHFSDVWTTQNWVERRRQWLRMAEMFKAHRRRLDMNMRWCKRLESRMQESAATIGTETTHHTPKHKQQLNNATRTYVINEFGNSTGNNIYIYIYVTIETDPARGMTLTFLAIHLESIIVYQYRFKKGLTEGQSAKSVECFQV